MDEVEESAGSMRSSATLDKKAHMSARLLDSAETASWPELSLSVDLEEVAE